MLDVRGTAGERDIVSELRVVVSAASSKTPITLYHPLDASKGEVEGEQADDSRKKGRGGCGHVKPRLRKEGSKLFLQYKKAKDDDEVCDLHCFLGHSSCQPAGVQASPARQASLYPLTRLQRPAEDLQREVTSAGPNRRKRAPRSEGPHRHARTTNPSLFLHSHRRRCYAEWGRLDPQTRRSHQSFGQCEEQGALARVITEFEQLLQVSRGLFSGRARPDPIA